MERILRLLFLGMAVFDLALAIGLLFFGGPAVALVSSADHAEPRFFQYCVGLFLLQYVYIQYMAYRDPRAYSTCANMTLAVRFGFPFLYVSQVFLWGAPYTTLHTLLLLSAAGDAAAVVTVALMLKRMGVRLFQGDATAAESAPISRALRWILLVLAISEFAISWNWLLIPNFWLKFFAIDHALDPFWTRATGLFLLNIAYIQYLGFRDQRRYRTAVITSGIFRALWPVLYWCTVAVGGTGNRLFNGFILFFSFFDLVTCIVIFYLLHRVTAARGPIEIQRDAPAERQPAELARSLS